MLLTLPVKRYRATPETGCARNSATVASAIEPSCLTLVSTVETVEPFDDVNEIVIAGMGAYTILDILKASEVKVERCVKCIIQTNSHPELIRTYLSENNYRILNEELIEEEGKYYDIIIFEPRNGTTLSDVEIYFGPCHLKEKSTWLISYYQKVLETKYKILENLNSSNAKYLSLKEEIEMIKKELQL